MGGRKRRNINQKKGIFIIGEGLTEQYYFTHLKKINNYKCIVKPRFFGKTDISQIEKAVKKLLLGDVMVICVFDADVSKRNAAENEKLKKFKKQYNNEKCIIICDSLPSIEFWFLLHFVKTNKYFANSSAVENELKKHLKGYCKTQKYLQNTKWVENLSLKLNTALNNVEALDFNEEISYSNIYKAFGVLAS